MLVMTFVYCTDVARISIDFMYKFRYSVWRLAVIEWILLPDALNLYWIYYMTLLLAMHHTGQMRTACVLDLEKRWRGAFLLFDVWWSFFNQSIVIINQWQVDRCYHNIWSTACRHVAWCIFNLSYHNNTQQSMAGGDSSYVHVIIPYGMMHLQSIIP
jgi:hypothetical protein